MDYSKLKLDEFNKINVFCNFLIKDSIDNISSKYKYIHFYSSGNFKNLDKYIYYICIAEKNMELFMDTPSLLDGKLNNKYSYISEEHVILMFMKIKIHIFEGINTIEYEPFLQDLYDSKILDYENFLEKDTLLLNKDIDYEVKTNLILKEVKRVKLSNLGFFLILSYYFYKYDNNKKLLLDFINKVEKKVKDFVDDDKNLNVEIDFFWKYLITCI